MAGLMTPTSHRMALPCLEKSVFESQKNEMKSLQPAGAGWCKNAL
jgi:hypothetical protein